MHTQRDRSPERDRTAPVSHSCLAGTEAPPQTPISVFFRNRSAWMAGVAGKWEMRLGHPCPGGSVYWDSLPTELCVALGWEPGARVADSFPPLTCYVTLGKSGKLSGPRSSSPLTKSEGKTKCPPGFFTAPVCALRLGEKKQSSVCQGYRYSLRKSHWSTAPA